MEKFNNHTQLPWEWVQEDNSTISLGFEDAIEHHVLTCHPCDACMERGGLPENRCTCPKPNDMAFIKEAVNSYYPMREKLMNLKTLLSGVEASLKIAHNYVRDDGYHKLAVLIKEDLEGVRKNMKELVEFLQVQQKPLTTCKAGMDGECIHPLCPQNNEGEPAKTGRFCPLPHWSDDPEY